MNNRRIGFLSIQNKRGMNLGNSNKKSCFKISKKIVSIWIVFLLILIIANSVNARSIIFFHHITMVQGDDPSTEEIELESEISVLERYGVYIPWNESIVEVALPFGAKSWDIDHVVYLSPVDYIPGEYSTFYNPENPPYKQFIDMSDMDCCYAHRVTWGFPEGADRSKTESIYVGTETEFSQHFNDTRSDNVWNFSASGLKLRPGNASGKYISLPLLVPQAMGINITGIKMSWNIAMYEENVSISVSNNNGTDWFDINGQEGKLVNFSTQGKELVWRINMSQNIYQNNTPILEDLWVNATYIPIITNIYLNLAYKLERNPDTNKFDFTLDLYDDHIDYVNPHILIFINDDHILESKNITMVFTEDIENMPDKNRYSFVSGSYMPIVDISVQKVEKEEENEISRSILLILLLIVILIAMILLSRARLKESKKPSEAEDEEPADSEEELEELEKKKAKLLKAIKKLDKDFEEGLIDEDVYNELRNGYKSKAAEVMKQIDVVAVSAPGVTKTPKISPERASLMEKKEKILKSIKKLDSDYEEGLLDEDVYQDLRKSYKEKAVKLLKELDEE